MSYLSKESILIEEKEKEIKDTKIFSLDNIIKSINTIKPVFIFMFIIGLICVFISFLFYKTFDNNNLNFYVTLNLAYFSVVFLVYSIFCLIVIFNKYGIKNEICEIKYSYKIKKETLNKVFNSLNNYVIKDAKIELLLKKLILVKESYYLEDMILFYEENKILFNHLFDAIDLTCKNENLNIIKNYKGTELLIHLLECRFGYLDESNVCEFRDISSVLPIITELNSDLLNLVNCELS